MQRKKDRQDTRRFLTESMISKYEEERCSFDYKVNLEDVSVSEVDKQTWDEVDEKSAGVEGSMLDYRRGYKSE
ncbi:unnamed protein product [Allacma fusca]|uniref:Uncharacterized protein n=1 Tax=Allacma fusca TaxID=39272 RepID=A0A8J2JXS6_9HEXA|nr:unnamed protein product [Allacma fusca]